MWSANIITFILCISQSLAADIPRVIGKFPVPHPGFVTLARNTSDNSADYSWNLLITRFNGFPFSKDYVSIVRGAGAVTANPAAAHVHDLSNTLSWPNEPSAIPDDVFYRRNMIVIPSGFIVPTKNVGQVSVFDLDGDKVGPFNLIPKSDGTWFYHRVIWVDMDGDSLLDAVTCRAHKPLFGDIKSQFIWYKQPNISMPWTQEWKGTVLAENAADSFLIMGDMSTPDGVIRTFITAGYFSKSLDIWWQKDRTKPWTTDNLNKRVIDNTHGAAFSVVYADVNGDIMPDLLVTYNSPTNGTVFVYDIPKDFRTGSFVKHMIMDGLKPSKSGMGKGAPGAAMLAYKEYRKHLGKPDIVLSGDDNSRLYLLRSASIDSSNWTYTATILMESPPGTIGQMAIGDTNSDNYTEIIVPSYNDGIVTVLTYAPEPSNLRMLDRLKTLFMTFF